MNLSSITEEQLKSLTRKELERYDEEEQKILLQIIQEISDSGESQTLKDIWYADYEEIPVDIDTFLDDPYYIGESGKTIYPAWREELRNMFDPKREDQINEVVLTGAIGLGKSQIAVTAIAYVLYNLLCLRSPQDYYKLSPKDKISIVLINVSLAQSNVVAYSKLMGIIQDSPWFAEHGLVYEQKDGSIKYIPDKNIKLIVGSNENHVIGTNVFCLVGETKIPTTTGEKKLAELNGEWFKALQYNCGANTLIEGDECTVMQTGLADELIELEFEDGTIERCTPNHLWLVHTPDGYEYKEAQYLDEFDDIVNRKEELETWINQKN